MSNRAGALLPRGLYALCDDTVRPELSLAAKAQALLDGGVRVIQLRGKRASLRELADAATEIAARCRAAGAVLIVNDRVDVALVAEAAGAHVGDEDLPAEDARRVLGPGRLLGVTCRSLADLQRACAAGADYAGVGPVFATATKRVDAPVLGVAGLEALVRQSPLPVVAISGIGLANIAQVARTGAHGAAVLSDLLLAGDIAARARALSRVFEEACAKVPAQR